MANYGGTTGNDSVHGSGGTDTLAGGLGNDTLVGLGSNDSLIGDAGADVLNAGTGNDTVSGGTGNDLIYGGADTTATSYPPNFVELTSASQSISGTNGQTNFSSTITSGDGALLAHNFGSLSGFWIGDGDSFETHTHSLSTEVAGARIVMNATNTMETVTVTLDGVVVDLNRLIGSGQATFNGNGVYGLNSAGQVVGLTDDQTALTNTTCTIEIKQPFTSLSLTNAIGGNGTIYEIYVDTNPPQVFAAAGGDDLLSGEDGDDSIYGGTGQDTLYSDAGADQLFGGTGDDIAYAGLGADLLYGAEGRDTLIFGAGNDTVYGGAGDDLLDDVGGYAETGNNLLDGGDGYDTLWSGFGADTLFGGADDDYLNGDQDGDLLFGGTGNDLLDGSWGNDTLTGGDGFDTVYGAEGNDRLMLGTDDTLIGGADQDTLDGTTNGVGDTIVFTGSDVGYTNTGSDFLEIEAFETDLGADFIDATVATDNLAISTGADNDTVFGGIGSDLISGGAGDDLLKGGVGEDILSGGIGNDVLRGGAQDDILTGGQGADSFAFETGSGTDLVQDFEMALSQGATLDQLDVAGLRTLDGSAVRVRDVWVGTDPMGDAVLYFPEGETVVLRGVSPSVVLQPGMLNAMGVPCFAQGTRIQTPKGQRPVETLVAGDLVLTAQGTAVPVLWHGRADLDAAALRARPVLRPIQIKAGVLGNPRALTLSPQHAVVLGREGHEVLVRAGHLAKLLRGVRRMNGARGVSYHHLLLPKHAVIFAEGAKVESLYPGPVALAAFGPVDRTEMLRAMIAARAIALPANGCQIELSRVADFYGPRCLSLLNRKEAETFCASMFALTDSRATADLARNPAGRSILVA